MEGKPFRTGGIVNLANGEFIKDIVLPGLPAPGLFVIECVGINGFMQTGQKLFTALEVQTNSGAGVYPFELAGVSPYNDPTYPARSFGSHLVLLYADPRSELRFTASRFDAAGDARVCVDVSGRMLRAPRLNPLSRLRAAKKVLKRRR